MKDIVLVVPCYDEAERLDTAAFETAVEANESLQLLFVNDGSRDETEEVLRELTERLPMGRSSLVSLSENVGKAEAVRRGILHVLEEKPFGADLLAFGYWDADLSTPLDAVDEFAAVLQRSPRTLAVIGARVNIMGREIERRAMRHYSGRVFATLAAFALRFPVYDTQCGAKLFRASPEMYAVFDRPFATRWAFDVEVLARIAARHGRDIGDRRIVIEHPLQRWTDVPGSKVRFRDLPRMIRDAIVIYRRY